jgi:hypothetical protein
MVFSLEVRRARKGDCLLLHYGSKGDPGLVMIDGGPKAVYGPHLRPRLADIRAKRVKDNKPLPVDLLLVSHVDDDHIQGILDFTRELRNATQDQQAQPFAQIQGMWHNSFDNIIAHNTDPITDSVKGKLGEAAVNGDAVFSDDDVAEIEDHFHQGGGADGETVLSSLKVLASIQQGAQLRHDAEMLGIPINAGFEKLIIAGKKPFDLGKGLSVVIVGPMAPEIDVLRKSHVEWLKSRKKAGKKPAEVLAAYVDKSVPNLSSIVLLASVKGKRMLLTGDSRGDKILQGLEASGQMKKGGRIEIDVLKVPHHGSSNNLAKDFFGRIIAKHYVFSGDGEHGNPERETMEMLFEARGDDDYAIHLTYPIHDIDKGREADWKKEQSKEKKRKTGKARPNWSKEHNSLRAFFDAHGGLENKLKIVDVKEPHVIELLDPLSV